MANATFLLSYPISDWIHVLCRVKLSTMKINLIKNTTLNNALLILLLAILVSCDSVGDSNNGDTQNADPANPTMQPAPVTPTLQPPVSPPANPIPTFPPLTDPDPTSSPVPRNNPSPTAQPTQAPPTPTPTPTNAPAPTQPPDQPLNDFQSLVLDLVNSARAQGRNCGNEFFPAAPEVIWDIRIQDAALAHSVDMAQNQNFSHTGTDGSLQETGSLYKTTTGLRGVEYSCRSR